MLYIGIVALSGCSGIRIRRVCFPVNLSWKKDLFFRKKIQLNCTLSVKFEFFWVVSILLSIHPQPLSIASLSLFW